MSDVSKTLRIGSRVFEVRSYLLWLGCLLVTSVSQAYRREFVLYPSPFVIIGSVALLTTKQGLRRRYTSVGLLACVLWMAVCPVSAMPQGFEQGKRLFASKDYASAQLVFEAVADSGGERAGAHYYLGLIHHYAGEYEKASEHLEKAVELEGKNVQFRLALARVYRDRLMGANFLAAPTWAGRWKNQLETAFEIEPSSLEVRRSLINYYLNAPGIAGGDKEKGKQLAEETIAISHTEGRLLLAYAHRRAEEWESAIAQYRNILEREPRNLKAWVGLGRASLGTGNLDAARKCFAMAIDVAPDSALGYSALGDYYEKNGNHTEAVAQYEKALEVDPTHGDSRYELALIHEKLGNRGTALAHLRKLLELNPGTTEARNARERLLKLEGS